MRNEMIALHRGTDEILQGQGIAVGLTYLEEPDIHTFFMLRRNMAFLIHLRDDPTKATPALAFVEGRLMRTEKWLQARRENRVPVGDETDAIVHDGLFFRAQIPNYDPNILAGMIKGSLDAALILKVLR